MIKRIPLFYKFYIRLLWLSLPDLTPPPPTLSNPILTLSLAHPLTGRSSILLLNPPPCTSVLNAPPRWLPASCSHFLQPLLKCHFIRQALLTNLNAKASLTPNFWHSSFPFPALLFNNLLCLFHSLLYPHGRLAKVLPCSKCWVNTDLGNKQTRTR